MTDPRVLPSFERALSWAMLAGVWLSAALLAAGLLLAIRAPEGPGAHVLLRGGLVVLMCTPVARVVLSVAEAIRQRDWFWLWTTAAVALVLSLTLAYALTAVR